MKIYNLSLVLAVDDNESEAREVATAVSEAIEEKLGVAAVRISMAEVNEVTAAEVEEALAD